MTTQPPETSLPTPSLPRIVSQLDSEGYFWAAVVADPSPQEPDVFHIPGGAIDLPPPEVIASKCYRPDGRGGWTELDDNRSAETFLIATGATYTPGQVIDGARYDGTGPLPSWLTSLSRPNPWSKWDGQTWVEDADARSVILQQQNANARQTRIAEAGAAIAPLQDAVDLGIATPKEAELLHSWKLYRVMLTRVDTAQARPDWPDEPG